MVFNLLAVAICLITGEWVAAIVVAVLTTAGHILKRRTPPESPSSAAQKLRVGDTHVVHQGESVLTDGIVVQGTALVDQFALTGDHKSLETLVGDSLSAGSLVKAGQIKMRVTRTVQDSTVEHTRFLLQEAEGQPAPIERASERLSWLFLITMGLAGAAAWAFLRNAPMMIAFFLFAGGDELAYSMKLLMKSTLAKSAKHGAVVKNGRWLEPLATLRTLAFEKASLVTPADLHVGKLEHDPSISDAFVWECVSVAEKYSEHVVGRALFRTAAKHVGAMHDPDEFQAFPNKGVYAVLQSHEIILGTAELLRARNISFDHDWLAGSTSPVEGTGSDTFVALDGICIARIRLQDRPQTEIRESLKRLREMGVPNQILFTNDTVRIAGSFAQAIGVSDYRPSMKTEDISHEIGRLAQTGTVALVGDDMRHAQALVRADLGIVMSHAGRGLHASAAGLVLMTDDLTRLPETILLARRTKQTWKYMITYWTAVNTLGIGLILVGILNPLFAALFAFLLSRLPLLNAPRWMLR
jgi:cation transport ATPase